MFKFTGMLLGYGAFRDHGGLFPTGSGVVEKFSKELNTYSTRKGTIPFPADKPLPDGSAQENRESSSRRKPGMGRS